MQWERGRGGNRPRHTSAPRLVLAGALLIAGCATSAPPSRSSADTSADARPATEYRRCSPADPDRFAWFCLLGHIMYGAISAMQPASTPGLR